MRLILLAGAGVFPAAVLESLLAAGHAPACVAVAEAADGAPGRDALAVRPPHRIEAALRGAPVALRRVGPPGAGLAAALAALEPDVLLVACHPRRLSGAVLERPPGGCFNLHPSLLPAYRGPDPLFWQLRAGERYGGVTLHRMTASFDAGPIVGRRRIPLPAGQTEAGIERALAPLAAGLVGGLLRDLRGGGVAEEAQDERLASRQPLPDARAYRLDTAWSAERAFRFVRGTGARGNPYTLQAGGRDVVIERALRVEACGPATPALRRSGREVWIRFADGVLHAVGFSPSPVDCGMLTG